MVKRFISNLVACFLIFFAGVGLISTEALWRRIPAIVLFLFMAAAFLTTDGESDHVKTD